MIKKLKVRLILIIMGLISIALAALLAVLISSSREHMQNDSYRMLDELHSLKKDEFIIFSNDYNGNYSDDHSNVYNFFIQLDDEGKIINIIDESGVITYEISKEVLVSVINQRKNVGQVVDFGLIYKKYDNNVIGFIDYSHEEVFMNKQIRDYKLIILGSLIVFLIISIYLSNVVVKPIERMWKKQQQFVMDASHELKTPITVMRANASILLNSTDDDHRKWISNIDSEAEYMQQLIDDMLMLAKLDAVAEKELFEELLLSNIITETAMSFEPLLYDANLGFKIDIEPNISINGIDSHIRRLSIILLDNARKYSHSGTTISLKLKKYNKKVILTVNNFGDVITKDDIENIFDRFYMVDKSRKRKGSSYGLGLAIANEIVNIHGANISVESSKEKGNTFKVTFY